MQVSFFIVLCDNQFTHTVSNSSFDKRIKHNEIDYHVVKDKLKSKLFLSSLYQDIVNL